MILFLFHCFLAILMTIFINSLGSINRGYVALDSILSTSNLGYNLLYRILAPSIFIALVTIILYWLNLEFLTKDIWLASLYYFLLNLLVLLFLNRFVLINKGLYSIIVIFGVGIAYWVYSSALIFGPEAILPDPDNFRTEWWFIVFAFIYNLFNNFTPNYVMEGEKKIIFCLNDLKS